MLFSHSSVTQYTQSVQRYQRCLFIFLALMKITADNLWKTNDVDCENSLLKANYHFVALQEMPSNGACCICKFWGCLFWTKSGFFHHLWIMIVLMTYMSRSTYQIRSNGFQLTIWTKQQSNHLKTLQFRIWRTIIWLSARAYRDDSCL